MVALKSHDQLFCTFSFSLWLVHWDLPRPAACKERWINKVILPQHFYSAVSIFSAMDVLNVNFFPGLVLWYFFKDDFHHWVFLAYGSSSRWPLPISPILWPTKKTQYKTLLLLLDLPELMQTRATIIPNTRSCDGFQQSHLPSLCSISKCHGTVFLVFV